MLKGTDKERKIYNDLKNKKDKTSNPNAYLQELSHFSLIYQMNHEDELQMDYHEYFKQFFIEREEIEDYMVALGNATMLKTDAMFESRDKDQLYKLLAKNNDEPLNINKLQTFIGNENTINVIPVSDKDKDFAFHIIDSMVYQIGI